MAFTQSDLDTIEQAIASGALLVRFADRTVEYQSLEALLKARAVIQANLSTQNGTMAIRQRRVFTTKG